MSVFITLTPETVTTLLEQYAVGEILDLQPTVGGVENSNWFLTTTRGDFVLTRFEHLLPETLVFYTALLAHLSASGFPCPQPQPLKPHINPVLSFSAVAALTGADYLSTLMAKPAMIATKLAGQMLATPPEVFHCAEVGRCLAQLHLRLQDFSQSMPNWRGKDWCLQTIQRLTPYLSAELQQLLREAEAFAAPLHPFTLPLPHGLIHGDSFRDNVLWRDASYPQCIDFYFAATDHWLYDVAITATDWCTATDGRFEPPLLQALLQGYHQIRPFTALEKSVWPKAIIRAALRTLIGRLEYRYLQDHPLAHTKDIGFSERLLRQQFYFSQVAQQAMAICH